MKYTRSCLLRSRYASQIYRALPLLANLNRKQRDFISFLPSELLSEIFSLAYKDEKPPLAPISRAFLPFQRTALFRHVKIESPPQLELLIEAYEANSGLGRMVETMEIENVEQEKEKSRNDRQLKTFFSTLIHLEQLKLGKGTSSLINLVLSLRFARSDLPRLYSLEFDIPADWKKPFDSKIYRYLKYYPSLRTLRLATSDIHKFSCSSRGGEKVKNVKELSLAGINVDHHSTLSFVQNFSSLESLSLDTLTSHHADYPLLVRSLPTPLTSLSLRNLGFYDEYSKPCDQHFPRLVNLEYLYLSEGTFTRNLINPLHRLPKLKTLGFGRGAIMDVTRLEELIIGPNRLSRLETVIFDQVDGKIGWQIDGDGDGMTLHPDHLDDYNHLGPGWEMPQFFPYLGRDFGDDKVKELVKKIGEAGIKVEGTIHHAFEVYDAWCMEIVMCEMGQVMEAGNFDEVRERHGEEYVKELQANWGIEDEPCECGECPKCMEMIEYFDCMGHI